MEGSRYHGVPRFVYGGAFKKDQTGILVEQAILQGFSGVDTAVFTGSYNEKLTGEGVQRAMTSKNLKRSEIWLQTKFTPYLSRIDPKYWPYDTTAPIETQVDQSVAVSLRHLDMSMTPGNSEQSPYLDNLTLHAPYPTIQENLRAWKAMEKYVPHKVSTLGISNAFIDTLRAVYENATVKPTLVQNCFPDTDDESAPGTPPTWDIEVRQFCREHGIVYQPYGCLKKTQSLRESKVIFKFAKEIGLSAEISLYLFILGLGDDGKISILDGTTKQDRMAADLEGLEWFHAWYGAGDNKATWDGYMAEFRKLLGEREAI